MTGFDIYLMMVLPQIRALCFDLAAIAGVAIGCYAAFTYAVHDDDPAWLKQKLQSIPRWILVPVILTAAGRLIPDQTTATSMLAFDVLSNIDRVQELPPALVDAAITALEEYSQSRGD